DFRFDDRCNFRRCVADDLHAKILQMPAHIALCENTHGLAVSLSMIGCGVPDGAIRPNHTVVSKPVNPASASVGTSGSAAGRAGAIAMSARSLPSRTSGNTTDMLGSVMVTRPASRSGSNDGMPR